MPFVKLDIWKTNTNKYSATDEMFFDQAYYKCKSSISYNILYHHVYMSTCTLICSPCAFICVRVRMRACAKRTSNFIAFNIIYLLFPNKQVVWGVNYHFQSCQLHFHHLWQYFGYVFDEWELEKLHQLLQRYVVYLCYVPVHNIFSVPKI